MQETDLQDIFGADGSLARALKGFVPRRQQLHMAERVADALAERRTLVIEAGAGTGKTFGYLVPVLMSGLRVLVSTGTRTFRTSYTRRICRCSAGPWGSRWMSRY